MLSSKLILILENSFSLIIFNIEEE